MHRVPHSQRVRAAAAGAAAGDGRPTGGGSSGSAVPAVFTNLERLITDTMGPAGPGGDWREVEGSWVLYPPASAGAPRCLIHFTGGAFVAAAPQVAYAPLLQALAARGALIVATPFATGFDHLRTADEIYFKFSRCVKALGPQAQMLPAYGLGHSLGALMQLFICSRYVVPRAGNILMSESARAGGHDLAGPFCAAVDFFPCSSGKLPAQSPSLTGPPAASRRLQQPPGHRLDPLPVALHRTLGARAGPAALPARHLPAAHRRGAVGGHPQG